MLVVDDDALMRQVVCEVLDSMAIAALQACDGVDALAVARQHRPTPDAVVLDLSMPRMEGRQAFTSLRRVLPRAPMVVISGWRRTDPAVRFIEGQKNVTYLQKPFRVPALQRSLRLALRR